MISLEEYYTRKEKKIQEAYYSSDDTFEINYNDSGIMKLIKKFLNWMTGKTEKPWQDPTSSLFNNNRAEEEAKKLASEGKHMDLTDIKEIGGIKEMEAILNQEATDKKNSSNNDDSDSKEDNSNVQSIGSTGAFMNFNNSIITYKDRAEHFKDCKFCYIAGKITEISKDGVPVVMLAYKVDKDKNIFHLKLVEAVNEYTSLFTPKDFLDTLKKFIKNKVVKRDKNTIKNILIRCAKYNKITKVWSYDPLVEFMHQNSAFERTNDYVLFTEMKDKEITYITNL